MDEQSNGLSTPTHIWRQQYLEIEKQRVQLLDMEEENRLLRQRNQELLKSIAKKSNEAEALQKWCAHLQEQVDELDELRKWSGHLQEQVDELDGLRKWSSHLQERLDAETLKNEEREAFYQRLKKKLGIFYPVVRRIAIWLHC